MSRKFFVKDTDYATEDTAGVVKVGEGLRVDNGILSADNGGASGSCIVCSPTQPTDLKTGLWIETNSTKDIKITGNNDLIEIDRINKMSATLNENIYGSSSCAINGKAYIFGGYNSDNTSYVRNYIQCYDPEINTCTTMSATLRNNFWGISSCAINGKAYIFGGTSNYSNSNFNYYSKSIQCYDPETNTCTTMTAYLNSNRGVVFTSSCAINGKAYIFGGRDYDGARDYIQCYDPETNTCTTMSATLYIALNGTSSCTINGKAYIFGGGTSEGGNSYDYIQCYDPETDTLTKMSTSLSNKYLYGTSSCAINGKAYIFGGYNNCIQCYDPVTDTRITMPSTLYTGKTLSSSCAINGKAYIFGGRDSDCNNYIQCYDPNNMCKDSTFSNSIIIVYTSGESTNLVALSNDSSSSGQNIYKYESVNRISDVSEDNIAVPLQYHKIENHKIV